MMDEDQMDDVIGAVVVGIILIIGAFFLFKDIKMPESKGDVEKTLKKTLILKDSIHQDTIIYDIDTTEEKDL